MDAERLLALLALLGGRGIPTWIDGGWCVDALLGRQTRAHDDLDLAVAREDVERLCAALAEAGYAPWDDGTAGSRCPDGLEYLVDERGHQVDVHRVRFTPDGDGVHRMANGEDWIYPARAFAGRGRVLGREVACLAADVMLVCHTTGYALDAAHRADAAALADAFALPLPSFRWAEDEPGERAGPGNQPSEGEAIGGEAAGDGSPGRTDEG